jgi:hypothetical protein
MSRREDIAKIVLKIRVKQLLRSAGRPMTMTEIHEAIFGVPLPADDPERLFTVELPPEESRA